jgi:hypothetical protein
MRAALGAPGCSTTSMGPAIDPVAVDIIVSPFIL